MDYSALAAFLEEYNEHYRSFLKFEYKKLDMINKDDIEKLSESLSAEQALIMKANSLESRRLKLLGDSKDISFTELIAQAPVEYKERLSAIHKELSENVYKIKEINDMAGIIVNERLRKIRNKVGEIDTYDGKGGVHKESRISGKGMVTNA